VGGTKGGERMKLTRLIY